MTLDIRGVRLFNGGGEEPTIELARLTFKSSGISLYLPKRICTALQLDKDVNGSLVIVAVDSNCIFLIKDISLAAALKPQILDMRKKLFENKM
jgi:hypothetical protein